MARYPRSLCSRKLRHPWAQTGKGGREGCLQNQGDLGAWKRGPLVGEGVDEAALSPLSSSSCPTFLRSLPWMNPVNSTGRAQIEDVGDMAGGSSWDRNREWIWERGQLGWQVVLWAVRGSRGRVRKGQVMDLGTVGTTWSAGKE